MKTQHSRLLLAVLLASASSSLLQAQTTLIDVTFDDVENDINPDFSLLTNNPSFLSGGDWDQVDGIITRGTDNNSASSAVSDTTIDVPAIGDDILQITFEVESASTVTANGIFFGLQNGTAGDDLGGNLWNNLGPSFGFGIRGTNGATGVAHFVTGKFWEGNFPAVAQSSFADGFTVKITITSGQWVIALTGLEDGSGDPVTGGSGSWDGIGFNFSDFATTMRAVASTQGNGGSMDLARITVVQSPNLDTDNDDLSDTWELAQTDVTSLDDLNGKILSPSGSGPGSGDFDGDLLVDLEEFNNLTDAGDEDSDDDLLLDGEEVGGTLNPFQNDFPGDSATTTPGMATNPLMADSDMDGLSDLEELEDTNGYITNPNTDDTDGDLLLDPWEIDNDLDPTDSTDENGDFGDPDEDLLDNFGEQEAGTDPHSKFTDSDSLTDFDEVDTYGTNPLDPDTDGDNLEDGEEVTGEPATDPLNADSDFDEFLDSVEIAAGSDPNLTEDVPTLASITWTAAEFTSEVDLITNGPLHLAENCNGPDATVNGISFASAIDDTAFKSTLDFGTLITTNAAGGNFYDDENPALSPLLENIWTGSADNTVSVFGLTPGKPYVIQVGRADDRNQGTIPGRFYTIDGVGGENTEDPTGTTNTIFGGPSNPAVLFTGSFIATASVQSFEIDQYNTSADTVVNRGANVVNFIQVRQTDDLSTGGPSLPVRVVSSGFNGAAFEITFENLDPSADYELVRSANLEDGFPTVVDGPRMSTGGATTDTFSDASPLPDKAFYVLELVDP